ncbi:class I SAM-dependent methyltransferase [Denitratisoma sp. agr-D3]
MSRRTPRPVSALPPLTFFGAGILPQLFGLFAAVVMAWVKPILLQYPFALAGMQALFATWVARLRQAPLWWQAIHLCFVPLLLLLNGLHLPPLLWLGGFVLLLLVYWRTDTSRVPLYLSNAATGEALASLLPAEPGVCLDLGCGTGGLLQQLAGLRPDCHFIGVEHAPIPYFIARWRNRHLSNVAIRYGDFWSVPLRGYQLVYAFLSPVPMARLWDKAQAEMEPGALLVANSFAVPDQVPTRILAVDDRRQTQLYCYHPAPGAPTDAE